MKRLMFVLAMVIFLMLGCSSGGADAPAAPVVPVPDVTATGTPPELIDYYLYSVDPGCAEYFDWEPLTVWENCPSTYLGPGAVDTTIGDVAIFWIEVWDPDLDIATITVKEYLKVDGEYMLYFGPESLSLPPQQAEDAWYLTLLYTNGPAGEYRDDFWLTDAEGNTSNIISLFSTISGSSSASQELGALPFEQKWELLP